MSKPKGGNRYPLYVFTLMMNRWRTAVFTLGLALIGLAWVLRSLAWDAWRWQLSAGLGAAIACVGIAMRLLNKSAYVQPFPNHLKLATPFLRLNISYKRFVRTSVSSMGEIFPRKSLPNSLEEIVEPIARMSAVVVEAKSLPMSQGALRFFLSPLFFKDKKTPNLVILVEDWMRFSAEMDSLRHGGGDAPSVSHRRDISILSKLPKK
ncbi:MAG: hypothetical protein LC099_07515 [Anaerolineales bacterium]|nr:hypothetical protein [Anaerolineales bacterium]